MAGAGSWAAERLGLGGGGGEGGGGEAGQEQDETSGIGEAADQAS